MKRFEIKKYLMTLLKVAAACILICYLFKSGRLKTENLLRLFDFESLPFLTVSGLAFLCSQVLSSVRMIFLLKVIEFKVKFIPIFKLTMIGNFFNTVIPGTIGGDIVKALYLNRNEGVFKGRSSGIVIVDRLVGLIALSLIGFISGMYMAKRYRSVLFPYQLELWCAITLSFVTFVSFVALIFICKHEPIRQRIRKIVLRVFPQGFFYNVLQGLALVTKRRRYILYAFTLSIAVQGVSLVGLLILVNLSGENLPDTVALVAVSSIVLFLGIIPLTPGNIGWTELLATFGWSALGAKGGADIFLSWRIITVLCSFLGGYFYLLPSSSAANTKRAINMNTVAPMNRFEETQK